jgi:hypothetical protein
MIRILVIVVSFKIAVLLGIALRVCVVGFLISASRLAPSAGSHKKDDERIFHTSVNAGGGDMLQNFYPGSRLY